MQFESIAGFGAIIDRLGQFTEVLDPYCRPQDTKKSPKATKSGEETVAGKSDSHSQARIVSTSHISLLEQPASGDRPLLELHKLSLNSPDGSLSLVEGISLEVNFNKKFRLFKEQKSLRCLAENLIFRMDWAFQFCSIKLAHAHLRGIFIVASLQNKRDRIVLSLHDQGLS